MNESRHQESSQHDSAEQHGSSPPPPPVPGAGWSGPSGTQDRPDPWNVTGGAQGHQTHSGNSSASQPGAAPHGAGSGPHATPAASTANAGSGAADTTVLAAPGSAPQQPKKNRGRVLVAGLVIGALIGGGAGAAVYGVLDASDEQQSTREPVESSLASNDNTAADTSAPSGSVEDVANEILPSVVSITVPGQFGQDNATGSGVIISSDGQILTNNHVVEAAGARGQLQVTFEDGTSTDVVVVGTDPMTDLAVIEAQGVSDLPAAPFGSSGELSVGEQVIAIGSPLGLQGTVTTGIVSALQRPVAVGEERTAQTVIDAVQTDAPINQGNSGGPLVNMSGEVIGINSAIATLGPQSGSIGLGFSIPIDQASRIAEELIQNGNATHAQIGIGVDTPQDTQGARVVEVARDGAAADSDLQQGDVITQIDDRVIQDHITLIAAVRSYDPGDEVTLTVVRDGEETTVDVVLGSDAQTT
ncbi:PDZ domain-containing protein [Actinobacteria bacterium YIM 96077]|uniref:PDZ domain-containing protein n=1 Tax=Phytoactinopolyspora halophila TaxID=1981511 RepID=A0A329QJG9_9ACTN|nr:trypsin-like peptidase domain-containing protein [Phytoactinopolyspora halophila]AYY13522.1 PDZ domain-containing protein [Actinobacteria bacterium YIM 96077]RAW12423.1 hypothetical protein DPM12_14765 [Phytoactinopolyspora halophila]